ncbi:hypothetical protein NYR30_08340 [Gallibacterium salpingitidis]|uniref:hypothetical protein n=1 Tax=Gallibacterium salpingitidis TaxID=505341 RepID=UPI00266EC368|nr:hypothetical protein [Gallibacterium salpingitidis]WKS98774.1 hypothetical protein NYR30_08340 [Gallibacterium salpingitidis]
MKFTHEPLYLVFAVIIAFILGVSCQPAYTAQYDKDADYYDHTLNIETELSEEQLDWEEQANQEWKSEHGEFQTPLTSAHEAEIRERLAKGVR